MKKILKTLIYCMVLFCFTSSGYSQHDIEIGIVTDDFDNLSLLYKKQKKENKWFRLRGSSLSFGYQDVEGSKNYSFGFSFGIGAEYRNPIDDKFSFIHGPEFFTSFSYQKANNNGYRISLGPGIGYLLGFRYEINDKFSLTLETRPSIRSQFVFGDDTTDRFNILGSFNSNAVGLGVAYRFHKDKK